MRGKQTGVAFLAGMGLGAAVMYFLDPDQGHGRRVLARDKVDHYARETGRLAREQARDLRNRARGAAVRTRRAVRELGGGDEVVVNRIRSALERVICHPDQVTVESRDGEVILRGRVYEEDASALAPVVSGVKGVRHVVDETEVAEEWIG